MELIISEAKRSAKKGQYALASAIVRGDKVLTINHTTLHTDNDPSAHAEMNAIRKIAKKERSKYLPKTWLYTTLEPCPMCATVAVWAKMEGIVYGASTKDAIKIEKKRQGKDYSWRQIDISSEKILNLGSPKLKLHKKFMREECIKLFDLNK